MPLSKTERQLARQTIEEYHQRKLTELQQALGAKFKAAEAGAISPFDLDRFIHRYSRPGRGRASASGRVGKIELIAKLSIRPQILA